MRVLSISSLLLSGAMMAAMAGAQAPAKAAGAAAHSEGGHAVEFAVTYNPTIAGLITSNGFSLQGASGQVHVQLHRRFGAVAEVGSLHSSNMNSTGVGLDLVTVVFGPRYTWAPARAKSYEFFGQGLVGGAYGMNSIFPDAGNYNRSATSLAAEMGGGVNVRVKPHVWVRAAEVEWQRTQLPNSTTNVQNNLKLGFGVVFKLK